MNAIKVKCPKCEGTGCMVDDFVIRKTIFEIEEEKGSGVISHDRYTESGKRIEDGYCDKCDGKGYTMEFIIQHKND